MFRMSKIDAKNPVAVVDGHIVTPEGPGFGITVDKETLARYRKD